MVDHLHGISTYQQLRNGGMSRAAIAAAVARGDLVNVHPNLYRHAVREEDERQLLALALLAIKKDGMGTGAAALRQQGHVVKVRLHHADVSVPYGTAVPELGRWISFRRSNHLAVAVPFEVEGLTLTPAWWAFGDLARDVVDKALAETIAGSIGANRIALEDLEDGLQRRGKFPGKKRLRRVLGALRSDLPFSATEMDAARRLRAAGLDVRLQHEVTVDGDRVYRLDLALPDLRINIEVDGPHHWLPPQAAADRQRDRLLREIDWLVERFSVYEIDQDPDAFVAAVLRIVERRRAQLAGRAA